MAGQRILDMLSLLRAVRTVSAKHHEIRQGQATVYAQTSSLIKAATSRIQPAVQQFDQSMPLRPVSKFFSRASSSVKNTSGGWTSGTGDILQQDHHYEKSEKYSTIDPVSDQTAQVRQSDDSREALPDGTIPPKGGLPASGSRDTESFSRRSRMERPTRPLAKSDKEGQPAIEVGVHEQVLMSKPPLSAASLSFEDRKILQRQSEDQIPSETAIPPPVTNYDPESAGEEEREFGVEQEQDLFYQPPGVTAPVLSALPRIRLPKIEWDIQAGDPHVSNGLNSDVYYSGGSRSEGLSDQTLAQIFQSPKVARMLGRGTRFTASTPFARAYHTRAHLLKNQSSSEEESIRQLAEDVAVDTEKPLGVGVPSGQSRYQMRESTVPATQLGRLFEYGGLAASMALSAVGEGFSRTNRNGGSLMLSATNVERLVAKLSKMRGAALKLGQMMSFQDSKLLPKPIHDVLQRVQDSADYMPAWQRDSVMAADLGTKWRDLFEMFEERPMAAASIGQVHGAVLRDGREVAVKVQYPGVAESISSDLKNLSILLTASRILPKGLYLDKTIANARTELAWECDYIREAESAKRFQSLLADDTQVFVVPKIIDEASRKRVLTMERMEGVAVTKIRTFTPEQRNWIGSQILRLCLREIFEFKFMQTDPNWTNFLYNERTNKIELLDFGASREYPENFIRLYIQNLEAASRMDRDACRDLSIQLGYLTGYESKAMVNAHIDSVMTLAEPFMESAPELYDFRDQTITDRVRALIPVMLRERLAPPPEETYSLHRKLSGAFLLCARLGSQVRCKELFRNALAKTVLAA